MQLEMRHANTQPRRHGRVAGASYQLSAISPPRRGLALAGYQPDGDTRSPVASPLTPRPSPLLAAFTLIELLVVVSIIVLLVAIAVPSVGPMMSSNQQTQMVQQLTGAVTVAQARAENRGGYAIRIERAFKVNDSGFMLSASQAPSIVYDATANAWVYNSGWLGSNPDAAPVWLDHQQIRFLQPPVGEPWYKPTIDDVIALPRNIWLAPDYAMSTGFSTNYYDSSNTWKLSASDPQSVRINPFETFCIVFNQRGEVIEARVGVAPGYVSPDHYHYQDQTQYVPGSQYPVTPYLYPSARGVIMYDRKQFESYGTDVVSKQTFLAQKGRPLFINRFLGSLVEGRQ